MCTHTAFCDRLYKLNEAMLPKAFKRTVIASNDSQANILFASLSLVSSTV